MHNIGDGRANSFVCVFQAAAIFQMATTDFAATTKTEQEHHHIFKSVAAGQSISAAHPTTVQVSASYHVSAKREQFD